MLLGEKRERYLCAMQKCRLKSHHLLTDQHSPDLEIYTLAFSSLSTPSQPARRLLQGRRGRPGFEVPGGEGDADRHRLRQRVHQELLRVGVFRCIIKLYYFGTSSARLSQFFSIPIIALGPNSKKRYFVADRRFEP